jgi:hypothetical protein
MAGPGAIDSKRYGVGEICFVGRCQQRAFFVKWGRLTRVSGWRQPCAHFQAMDVQRQ